MQVPVLAEARDGTWQIEFVEDAKDGMWKLELRNVKRFDKLFGRKVLNAFCQCFVHVDRLNSLISCMYTSEQHHGPNSVAYTRDLNTPSCAKTRPSRHRRKNCVYRNQAKL